MPNRSTQVGHFSLEENASASRKKKQSPEMKDNLGLLYDRDVLAFYGDPAWEARMAPHELPFTHKLTEKDGIYTFSIVVSEDCEPRHPPAMLLPERLKNIEVIEGKELSPLITDNFIMLMEPGKFEEGKTYDVVFKAERIEPSAIDSFRHGHTDGHHPYLARSVLLRKRGRRHCIGPRIVTKSLIPRLA